MEARIDPHPPLDSLKAFGRGLLDDASAQALYRHLETCPACRRQAEAASGDDFLLRLQRARDSHATPASARDTKASSWPSTVPPDPAKSLASAGRGIPVGQTTVPHLPPELIANEQYEVIRELGRGGMGVVYLARNKQMDRLEVLKVVNPAMLDRPDMVERFLREIRSAAALEHQNVVRAYSCLHLGKLLALVMQYVEGEDLARLVERRGPLSVSAACASAVQVARGLQEACKKGMVHRDIKPQNLLLSVEIKQVMILDFGLAKIASEKGIDAGLTGNGQMLGTPAYMAPEQSLDAAKADIRADIYSLGCTLYFLLTGEPPFKGKSHYEILQAHHTTQARPLNEVRQEVPPALAEVVAKMMAKDPAQRFQTPVEVASALAPFLKQGGKPTPPKSPQPLAPGVGRTDSMVGKTSGMGPVAVTHVGSKNEQATVIAVGNPPEVCATLIEPKATPATTKSADGRKRRRAVIPEAKQKWIIGAGVAAGVLLISLVGMWAGGVFEVKTKDGGAIDAKSFVSLFNGKDLKGWEVESGPENNWRVDDGAIVALGRGKPETQGYLLTEKAFSDFILAFDFQADQGTFGGVCFRAAFGESIPSTKFGRLHFHPLVTIGISQGENTTGRLYYYVSKFRKPKSMSSFRSPDSWNEMQVQVQGHEITVWVNGEVIQREDLGRVAKQEVAIEGFDRSSGRVGFLQITGEVRYRNVTIKELPLPKVGTQPGADVDRRGGDARP